MHGKGTGSRRRSANIHVFRSLFLGKHVGFQDFCNRFNESMAWKTEAESTIIYDLCICPKFKGLETSSDLGFTLRLASARCQQVHSRQYMKQG